MMSSRAQPVDRALSAQLQVPDGSWVEVGVMRSRQSYNEFQFVDSYFELKDRPILGYSFEFKPRNHIYRSKVALPRWFSHLLPEGRLRAAVAEVADVSTVREIELINRLGASDLPGALRMVPFDFQGPVATDGLEIEEPFDATNDEAVLKFSLAGAQMKFSVSRVDRALTIPVGGFAGDFILKLPDERPGFSHVPEAEHAAMNFARLIGIDVATTSLVVTSDVQGLGRWGESDLASLLVERFDRSSERRIHAEEFAQVLNIAASPDSAKYKSANFESVASTALSLVGEEAAMEVVRRIAFNALIGNGDAHLKNWGLLYPDGKRPQLSPAYDVLSTVAYIPDDDFGMNLGRNKRFESISTASFERMSSKVGMSARGVRSVLKETVEQVRAGWPDYLAVFSGTHRRRLEAHLERIPLARYL